MVQVSHLDQGANELRRGVLEHTHLPIERPGASHLECCTRAGIISHERRGHSAESPDRENEGWLDR